MSDDEYDGWVRDHCEATGAVDGAAVALASAVVRRYFAEAGASGAELLQCTYRLVAGARVPKFASEHSDAVALELRALRDERAAGRRPDPGATSPDAPACRWCGDAGLVTVPHPNCVLAPRDGPPRLVAYRDRNGVRYADVAEVSVVCDRPGCAAGRRVGDANGRLDRPRPALRAYLAGFAGGFDPVALLARHGRDRAARCRRLPGAGPDGFADLVARIKERAARAARGGAA